MDKTSHGTGKLRSEIFQKKIFQQQIVEYRAGAGAANLTSWSRSRAKIERLHNTAGRISESFIKTPKSLFSSFGTLEEQFFNEYRTGIN